MFYDSFKILASPWTGTPLRPTQAQPSDVPSYRRQSSGVPTYYHSQIVDNTDTDTDKEMNAETMGEGVGIDLAIALVIVIGGLFLGAFLFKWVLSLGG